MKKAIIEHGIYLKKFFMNPFKLGSVAPTSKSSANFLAKHIDKNGYIIELGAGTGSLTAGILDAGIDPKKLIAIEIDPTFCKMLEKKFPNLKIICADARNLKEILSDEVLKNISCIVSAMPLLHLSKNIRIKVISAITECIEDKGKYIQVSYSPISPVPWKEFNLKQERYGTIFKNIPPITIFGYTKYKK